MLLLLLRLLTRSLSRCACSLLLVLLLAQRRIPTPRCTQTSSRCAACRLCLLLLPLLSLLCPALLLLLRIALRHHSCYLCAASREAHCRRALHEASSALALRVNCLLLLPLLSLLCRALLLLLRIALRLLLLTALLLGLPLLLLLPLPRRAFRSAAAGSRAARCASPCCWRCASAARCCCSCAALLLLYLHARSLFGLALLRTIDARRGILRLGRGRRTGGCCPAGATPLAVASRDGGRPDLLLLLLLLRATEACGVALLRAAAHHRGRGDAHVAARFSSR